jgi:hypothetical protein
MGETHLHRFLKDIAQAWLLHLDCFIVGAEVPLTVLGQKRIHELDSHYIVDACGIGERVIEERLGVQYIGNILRGVEVKVSASDFRNGFLCAACNYNYVITPMRLVTPSSLPERVGLIEYNKFKFNCSYHEDGSVNLEGIRLVRPARHRQIPQYQIDNATTVLAKRHFNGYAMKLYERIISSDI